MRDRKTLKVTQKEVTQAFSVGDWGIRYPPLLSIDQAADLLQVPKATIYQWNSEGKLTGCVQRLGKHLRFLRDRLVLKLMSKGV
ncbi:helix-turn-helix domain-containing protein [Gimesia chilikensis]|uniref:Helix-turn-helix domain protein n=1 Tax=Gimesia chilikensis TaxID=2605989 RepID=A0A517PST5_9PLAN|nr:helix-turn-helix domain-containing protein [Gimesia chilikensis]QDT22429.1 Helix-turn-helix domain protein [Gimesia chilikensis]QDT86369.1 Helix-turn-helix domain protein [Gimesia chilikensis]